MTGRDDWEGLAAQPARRVGYTSQPLRGGTGEPIARARRSEEPGEREQGGGGREGAGLPRGAAAQDECLNGGEEETFFARHCDGNHGADAEPPAGLDGAHHQ